MNIIFLIAGILIGFIFGFLLQKGNVANFNTIVNQLRLKDFTVAKIMLTAIIVGGLLTYSAILFGFIVKPLVSLIPALNIIIGSIVFGIGMAILGYCPGTCVAAAGSGSRDAMFGLVGIFIGAIIYMQIPCLNVLKNIAQIKTLLVHNFFGLNPIVFLIILCAVVVPFLYFLERKKL